MDLSDLVAVWQTLEIWFGVSFGFFVLVRIGRLDDARGYEFHLGVQLGVLSSFEVAGLLVVVGLNTQHVTEPS